jgi:crossover junction endodeoxyribonuclease RuvC
MILGIDVGVTGAWSALASDGSAIRISDLPTMLNGKKNAKVKTQVNAGALARELRELVPHGLSAYVEVVSAMPKQGVASMFSLGHSFGTVCAVLATLGIPFWLVTPQEWKKEFGLIKAEKDASRTVAIRMFPSIDLSLKKYHNRSESLLIAEYGRRRHAQIPA